MPALTRRMIFSTTASPMMSELFDCSAERRRISASSGSESSAIFEVGRNWMTPCCSGSSAGLRSAAIPPRQPVDRKGIGQEPDAAAAANPGERQLLGERRRVFVILGKAEREQVGFG